MGDIAYERLDEHVTLLLINENLVLDGFSDGHLSETSHGYIRTFIKVGHKEPTFDWHHKKIAGEGVHCLLRHACVRSCACVCVCVSGLTSSAPVTE